MKKHHYVVILQCEEHKETIGEATSLREAHLMQERALDAIVAQWQGTDVAWRTYKLRTGKRDEIGIEVGSAPTVTAVTVDDLINCILGNGLAATESVCSI